MPTTSKTHEMQMQLALEACCKVDNPNFTAIARDFPPVNHQTLKWWFYGQQNSQAEAISQSHKNLTNMEEEELIKHINMLTDCGLPPTSAMVQNIAEEMIGWAVGKNWTGQFVKRYKDRLQSVYLRNIDNMWTQSEYAPMIQHFFDLVYWFLLAVIVL